MEECEQIWAKPSETQLSVEKRLEQGGDKSAAKEQYRWGLCQDADQEVLGTGCSTGATPLLPIPCEMEG